MHTHIANVRLKYTIHTHEKNRGSHKKYYKEGDTTIAAVKL